MLKAVLGGSDDSVQPNSTSAAAHHHGEDPLLCWHSTGLGHPSNTFVLAPLRIEELSRDPLITMVHDIMYASEAIEIFYSSVNRVGTSFDVYQPMLIISPVLKH